MERRNMRRLRDVPRPWPREVVEQLLQEAADVPQEVRDEINRDHLYYPLFPETPSVGDHGGSERRRFSR